MVRTGPNNGLLRTGCHEKRAAALSHFQRGNTMNYSNPFASRAFDPVMQELAAYTARAADFGPEALETARWCLLDSLGCGLLALNFPACTKMLGPTVPEATLKNGARVPGTQWQLEPVRSAFNIGCM